MVHRGLGAKYSIIIPLRCLLDWIPDSLHPGIVPYDMHTDFPGYAEYKHLGSSMHTAVLKYLLQYIIVYSIHNVDIGESSNLRTSPCSTT